MKIGDKVVCVDDSPCKCPGIYCNGAMPVKRNGVFVIEGLFISSGILFIILFGVAAQSGHLRGVNASRFRLLDDMKQEARERAALRTDLEPQDLKD